MDSVKTPFHCPCCHCVPGMVDLSMPPQPDSRCIVVCDYCGAYVLREGDEWLALSSDDIEGLDCWHPAVLDELEARRLALVEKWRAQKAPPPTVFASVMVEMVRTRGPQSILWRRRNG